MQHSYTQQPGVFLSVFISSPVEGHCGAGNFCCLSLIFQNQFQIYPTNLCWGHFRFFHTIWLGWKVVRKERPLFIKLNRPIFSKTFGFKLNQSNAFAMTRSSFKRFPYKIHEKKSLGGYSSILVYVTSAIQLYDSITEPNIGHGSHLYSNSKAVKMWQAKRLHHMDTVRYKTSHGYSQV